MSRRQVLGQASAVVALSGSSSAEAVASAPSPSGFLNILEFSAKGSAPRVDPMGRTDSTAGIQAALTAAIASSVPVYIPAGTYLISRPLVAVHASNSDKGIRIQGAGRAFTTLKFVSQSPGEALDIRADGYLLNAHLSHFAIDCTGSAIATSGLRIRAGVWRSSFEDLRIFRGDNMRSTGHGIFVGDTAPASRGCYDLKFRELYVNGFDHQVHAIGTTLSGNTVTNLSISDSYLSGGSVCLYAERAQGLTFIGSQAELASVSGMVFHDCGSITVLGGTVESPNPGARGIVASGATQSVFAVCDFYNNGGGHFVGNGSLGHFVKTGNSGLVAEPGAEIRVDSDTDHQGRIRFFKNGIADLRVHVSQHGGNSVSITKADGTELFKVSAEEDGVFEVVQPKGKLRLEGGAHLEFLQGGVAIGVYAGAGNPNGVISAGPGSLFLNSRGGAEGTLWVKESGAGNSGWTVK